jgi:GGDEF domain-containing protein
MAALEEKLSKYNAIIDKMTEVVNSDSRELVNEFARLREELDRIRQEYDQRVQEYEKIRRKQQAMVTLKPRVVMLDGTVVEEYDLRLALRSELAAQYPYHVLGLPIIDEIRAVRESVSAGVNRVLSWIESIVKQELRERELEEDRQIRFRRLIGRVLTPEERERELTELEAKIDEAMKAAKRAQASRAGA